MKKTIGRYVGNIYDYESEHDYIDKEKIARWITVKGKRVPVLKGESVQEAIEKRTTLEKTELPLTEQQKKEKEKREKEEAKKKKQVRKTLTSEEKRRREIEARAKRLPKTKGELSEREKAIQKLIEETGYERERAEKVIEERMGKEEPEKEKPKKIEEKTFPIKKLQEKRKQLMLRVQELKDLNKKKYKSELLTGIIKMFTTNILKGTKSSFELINTINKIKKSKRIDVKNKEILLKKISSLKTEINEIYEGKDFIIKKPKEITIKYIGNINELQEDNLTFDFVNYNEFNDITSDFVNMRKDFSVLYGPITRAGPFEYMKNGIKVIYYKDWENIKEVFEKHDYVPLKASTDPGSHHAKILGYATNFKPNNKTEQMFADVVLFTDIEELTPLLNPEKGYAVSIGFEDDVKNSIQWIKRIDHLAMSLSNLDKDRCSTANGKPCNVKRKNDEKYILN